ncbi:MAG: site-2 protease family protein [Candidatus Babeliaceae bacterium]|nr:site-2 protease family protein [Candidatus Babeliaceae bacterium]
MVKKISLIQIIYGVIGIGLVIMVHEIGHWFFCKLFGVATPEFAVGFGPTLFETDIGTTRFTLNLIPLGGYVEILGMRNIIPGFEAFSFAAKPLWQQVTILLGGILFNLIFGFATLAIVAPSRLRRKPLPKEASEDPALHPKGAIGPLGILALISRSALYGPRLYAIFLALISLNLAIFNLLPLPILDGGQLLIVLIQAATGTMLSTQAYDLITTITLFLLVFLFLITTSKDIQRTVSD